MHTENDQAGPVERRVAKAEVPIDPSKIEALVEQLSSGKGPVRERARDTLVLIGPPAVPALMELLPSPDDHLRWEAAKALGEIGHPEGIPGLIRLLEDLESGVRWLAAVGLINIGFSSISPVLEALTEQTTSKTLRAGAHHVFHDLGSRNAVLRGVLKPVMEVLGETYPDSVIPPNALQTIEEMWVLQH